MTSTSSSYQQQHPRHLPARRTNSLAFAKSDCHTCASLGLHCGRQRPRCTICQDSGRLCQGYSMQLTWQQSHSAANKPPKVKAYPNQVKNGPRPQPVEKRKANTPRYTADPMDSPREFTFIPGRPTKRRKHHHVSEETMKRTESCSISGRGDFETFKRSQGSIIPCQGPAFTNHLADLPSGTMSETHILQRTQPEPIILPEAQYPDSPDSESLEQCLHIQQFNDSPATWSQSTPGSSTGSWSEPRFFSESEYTHQISLACIPQMCFATLHDKFSGLLNMYDSEFCKYPITNDFSFNPYRYRPETTKGSRHLLHAVLAITSHFQLQSQMQDTPPTDVLRHKNTAVVLYQGAVAQTDLYKNGLSLLDTTLALWQLEATISALNIWRSHLTDAYQLLELCGGPKKWSLSRKANVQVSMVLWWDAIVALLARTECVLPYAYLQVVLRHEGRQPWTFYELNGCPRELFVPMTQLANLSTRKESKVVSLLVDEIEQSVRKYRYPGEGLASDAYDEEAMQLERDRYHCCEGFRYALLIYILRIFTRPNEREEQRTASRISFLSRVCLDHVAACRSTSLIQKQLLFPVFIAGSETRNIAHREFAEEYCRRWFRKFGYQMYMTVLDVLEAVWSEQDAGNEDFWWGEELDNRRAKEGDFVQFCFG